MSERSKGSRLPPLPTLIGAGLVLVGVGLWMFVSKSLLVVAGIGAFGPGLARELGWLRDQDEFQRESARRAGHRAYLIGGLATVLAASALQGSRLATESPAEWVTLLLVVFWLTWLFDSLMAYWGARRTAARVLQVFGTFWAVFVAADLVGEAAGANAGEMLMGLLVGLGVVLPFFLLAWTAERWPRGTGVALLGVAVVFVLVFFAPGRENFAMSTNLMTALILLGPLVACGLGLVRELGSSAT